VGTPTAFVPSLVTVTVWAVLGPAFGYSDTWQLLINNVVSIVTFWLVFVIQHTQNRSEQALQLKLDEVLRALAEATEARPGLIAVDREDDADDEGLREDLEALRDATAGPDAPAVG
jgi:low affinity Fe/Cu permease